jgi:hypothetical protein
LDKGERRGDDGEKGKSLELYTSIFESIAESGFENGFKSVENRVESETVGSVILVI